MASRVWIGSSPTPAHSPHTPVPTARHGIHLLVQGIDDNEGEDDATCSALELKAVHGYGLPSWSQPNSDHQNSGVKSRYLVPICIDTF